MVVTVATVKVAGLVGVLAVALVADRGNEPGLEGGEMRGGDHQDRFFVWVVLIMLALLGGEHHAAVSELEVQETLPRQRFTGSNFRQQKARSMAGVT